MTLPALDRVVLSSGFAQIAQLEGTYDSKTDQTAQSDQPIETAGDFGASLAPELTARHAKLTSGTAQRPNPAVQVVGAPLDSAHARPSDGAPPS